MLCLYVEAPFAVCRTFTAGWYRPTAPFLTPTAAYGLLLNVAAIESRLWEHEEGHDDRTPASLTRPNLPAVRLALGAPSVAGGPSLPVVQTIFQQLHNYPVGKDAGVPEEWARGSKNNISPVRREYLVNLRAILCLDGNQELEERVRHGLQGRFNASRYGLPFLGDNQLLLDRLEERPFPLAAHWYSQVEDASGGRPRPGTARLTTWIDRADAARTRSALFYPLPESTAVIPESAWINIPPPSPEPTRRSRP